MVSVAKIKWFLQGRIISNHKILWKYIVKQPNFVKQPIAEKIASGKQTFLPPGVLHLYGYLMPCLEVKNHAFICVYRHMVNGCVPKVLT